VEKKRISAKQAVADIRSGMDDASLMTKYGLATDGLQSLFDKLVAGGYIDLGEIRGRIQGFLGTVVIAESDLSLQKEGATEASLSPKSKPSRVINAQEAARDVRAGMDDLSLMTKYRLSSKGLQSLFNKLVATESITQSDLDRRRLGFEHTVDLREEAASHGQALKHLFEQPTATAAKPQPHPELLKVSQTVKGDTEKEEIPSENKVLKPIRTIRQPVAPHTLIWYDKLVVVISLLLVFFPLGFYALYLNSRLSVGIKILVAAIWILLVIIGAMEILGGGLW